MIVGDIALVVALVTFSLCEEYYQFFLSLGLLGGFAAACIWTTTLVTTGHWFSKHPGIATAPVTTSGPIGGICFPVLFDALVPRMGFGWTVRIIALICLIMSIVALALMRTRLPASGKIKWNTNWKIFTEKEFGLTVIAVSWIESSFLVPLAYITPYALSINMSSSTAYLLLPIMNAAQIPGRLIPGLLADRWGRFNVIILCSLLCAISVLVLWMFATTEAAVIAFAIIFGFLSATASSLAPVCISQLCTTEDYGSECGTAYLYLSPAVLAGNPIAGQLITFSNQPNGTSASDYRSLILTCRLTYLCSALFFMLARIIGGGTSIKKKY
ncbi:hypothetical protein D6D01_10172 [Aureobasidium pullulans]|uniref:MFS general substrate transporter n=1 Tax=Aureobasidium pullulans TaxID=5580 RepID=A0A4S9JNT1_AURPU|nr:hypothetical protein D6D01_10172 [Aureobasidium pullulans]